MAETPRPDGELHRDPRHPELDEVRHADGRIEHPHVRHERTDVKFRGILIAVIGAMIFAAAVHWIVLRFFYSYQGYQGAVKQSPFPVAPSPAVNEDPRRIPEPRLEQVDRLAGITKENVYERQLAKEKQLHGYGPTEETGYVHVPIERAMDRLADKPLPARQEAGGDRRKEAGLVDAGEPNSGRMFRGKGK